MKSRIGILTDNTAQFTTDKFLGNQLIHTLPIGSDQTHFPNTANENGIIKITSGSCQQNHLPDEEFIRETLLSLNDTYHEIIIPVLSKQINPLFFLIKEMIDKLPNPTNFHLIDTQTISIGLGMIVQLIASLAYRGFSVDGIKKNIRNVIPKIYSIFCLKNLSFLYLSGLIDPAQAIVGEFLGITPCFLLENGQFIPTHKVKNFRHSIDLFLEFSSEFENVRSLALLHGDGYDSEDFHIFRSRINHQFSTATFSEHKINKATISILGPQTTGLVIMENI